MRDSSSELFSRRELFAAAAGAFLPIALQQDSVREPDRPAGRLPNPRMAGMPRERITDYENDPFIVDVESRLACTCGCTLDVYTCRTTDFTCGVSPAMHREVVELVQQGKTADEVIEAFVIKYGETVLMAPPKEGFNLLGYVIPGLAIIGVGGGLLLMLSGKTRGSDQFAPVEASERSFGSDISKEEAELLDRELADMES